jgi:hypothetical protein
MKRFATTIFPIITKPPYSMSFRESWSTRNPFYAKVYKVNKVCMVKKRLMIFERDFSTSVEMTIYIDLNHLIA